MNMFVSTWVLLVAGLVFALPMIHMRVQDSSREMDELCVFALGFSPHFLRVLPFFPRCLRRGLPCSPAPASPQNVYPLSKRAGEAAAPRASWRLSARSENPVAVRVFARCCSPRCRSPLLGVLSCLVALVVITFNVVYAPPLSPRSPSRLSAGYISVHRLSLCMYYGLPRPVCITTRDGTPPAF